MNTTNNPENFTSISPLDGRPLWSGEITGKPAISSVFERSAAAGQHWRTEKVSTRIQIARRFAQVLEQRKDEIASLITDETGKLPHEAAGEVSASIAKINWSVQAMSDRRSTTRLNTSESPARCIRYGPLGVTLVLGPFNFPLHLPGGQIVPSLLSGNSVVFKPSDQSTAVGAWMVDAWREAKLPLDVLQMIVGGVDVAIDAIDHPSVAAVFLTGSRIAGQSVHRQLAGRPEVLLALELGGNNPIVIDSDVDPTSAANHVSFSAFVSSGQRCTCARRAIFLQSNQAQQQIESLVAKCRSLTTGMPYDVDEPHLGPLVSSDAAASLAKTYDELIRRGCRPILPLTINDHHHSLVGPAIVDASDLDEGQTSALGQMEWFGPLLVIFRASDLRNAFHIASQTPYGLSASLLGGTQDDFDFFVDQVGAGVVNWNGPTTGAAGNLPFGGHGWSGNHRPAGYFATDFCNEPVSSIENQELAETDFWNPST